LSIQPLFVFDGPHKPQFKRNKRVGPNTASLPNMLAKQLLNYFGFPYHMAPGEAEAECALLQREGIVDAVLSEDVDTLMFGCGTTFRNWSSESRGAKAPTHVSVYEVEATKSGKAGLDREGMVLVALMSGGDYITEGIPGCGIKVACEAARAGYGKTLCRISANDTVAIAAWREGLAHEIQTNESKHFRVKHKALKIPEGFPNLEVLGYYTHPVVSSESKIQRLRRDIIWDGEIDIHNLRQFVAEAFDWTHRSGAKKFIRGLAPAMLIAKLRRRSNRIPSANEDIVLTEMNETELVKAICGTRAHFSTDALPELRVIYVPIDIVGLDLDAEEDDLEDYGRDGLATNSYDYDEERASDGDLTPDARLSSPSKRSATVYDPNQPEKIWIPTTLAKLGVPLKVEDYEASLRDPRQFIKAKHAAKRAAAKNKGGMPAGAMDKFVQVIKPNTQATSAEPIKQSNSAAPTRGQPALPPLFLAPSLSKPSPQVPSSPNSSAAGSNISRPRAQPSVPSPANTRRLRSKTPTIRSIAKTTRSRNQARGSPSSTSNHASLGHLPITKPNLQSKTREKNTFQRPIHSLSDFGDDSLNDISAHISSQLGDRYPDPPSSPDLPPARHSGVQGLEAPHSPGAVGAGKGKERAEVIILSSSPPATPAKCKTQSPVLAHGRGDRAVDMSGSGSGKMAEQAGRGTRRGKKFVMLRQSLEGAWTEVEGDEEPFGASGARAWADIEVLDLTGDD
jgi:Holliday junction resolvase YEN1